MAGRNAKADGEQASPVQAVQESAPETAVEEAMQMPEATAEEAMPAGHNGNNRRISAILRENRRTDPGAMLAANRRLRGECARLRAEISGRSK